MTSPIRKGRYFSVPGFPKPLPRLKGKKSKFEVRRTKGMEMGVFATRDIKRFETFLFERPYMVYPCQPLGFLAGSLSEEVENLDIDQQRQVMFAQAEMRLKAIVDSRISKELCHWPIPTRRMGVDPFSGS
jgi:hypothetical protein